MTVSRPSLYLDVLLDYTEWERDQWHPWLAQQGPDVLKVAPGPHGDGRFAAVGELIRHIFSAEKRYVERLAGLALTDTSLLPTGDVDALFRFGRQSRKDLRALIAEFPPERWDTPEEHTILKRTLRLTPKKIVVHTLMHEIRHWAQIATILRLHGLKGDFHDFLFSPVMGEP